MAHARAQQRLRARSLGVMMLAGAVLAGVSVVLPPAAERSEALVVAVGAVAAILGVALLWTRWRPSEAWLGLAVALGTMLITITTWSAGTTNGSADNEMLYVWVCLYSFYFLALAHALAQLTLLAAAYALLLFAEEVTLAPAVNQWIITCSALLIAGLLVARLRTSVGELIGELSDRARRDSLTGLLNRHELEERGAVEMARRRRYGTELSLITVDLDGFKDLNDTLGHPAGDEVLRRVSRVLDAETRRIDAVARVGGDEFVALLPSAGLPDALRIAERVLSAIRSSGVDGARSLTASIGVAAASIDTPSLLSLWAAADEALYRAKRDGGDRMAITKAGLPSPLPAAPAG